VRFAGGGFKQGIGLVLVSLGRKAGTDRERRKCYGWAAWFLVHAALLLVGGYLDSIADRPESPRT
jgi:hypothetical protein